MKIKNQKQRRWLAFQAMTDLGAAAAANSLSLSLLILLSRLDRTLGRWIKTAAKKAAATKNNRAHNGALQKWGADVCVPET